MVVHTRCINTQNEKIKKFTTLLHKTLIKQLLKKNASLSIFYKLCHSKNFFKIPKEISLCFMQFYQS